MGMARVAERGQRRPTRPELGRRQTTTPEPGWRRRKTTPEAEREQGAVDDDAGGRGQQTRAAEVVVGSGRCAVSGEGMAPVRTRHSSRELVV